MPSSSTLRPGYALFLLALAFALFPSVGKSLDDLRRSDTRVLLHLSDYWARWANPRSGEAEALPPPAWSAVQLLRAHGASAYRLSPRWQNNELPLQRLLDGSYPARVSATGAFLLGGVGEPLPADCRPLEINGEVSLAACP